MLTKSEREADINREERQFRALCGCAINAISAINTETPSHFIFTTQEILLFAQAVAKMKDAAPLPPPPPTG